MNIALISTTGFSTPPKAYGGETMVHDLAHSLCGIGHDVTLFATFDSDIDYGAVHIPLRKSYNNASTMLSSEYDVVEHHSGILKSVDIVHDFSHEKQVAEYCRHNDIPCITTLWGNTFRKPMPPYNIVCWSEAHRSCGLDGRSGYEGTPFNNPNLYSGSIPNAEIVYGGVNTDFYTPPDDKRGDYFLYVARPHSSKGTDIAIRLAIETGIKLKLAWRTASPDHVYYENQYLDMIKDHSNIEFVELPDDNTHHEVKMNLMRHAKAFLFPVQYVEAFGLAVAEAMACGTPVITTDRGSMPELVKNGINGFTCNTHQAFLNAIRHIDIIKNSACRRYAVDNFDRGITACNYVKLYEKSIYGERW
jgi:glycosyltransferase involved in cell wall biosynthesis